MKKFLNLLLLLLMFAVTAFAKGGEMPKYDMTGAGSGNEGMVLVKVFVYAKTVTDQDLKRAAPVISYFGISPPFANAEV